MAETLDLNQHELPSGITPGVAGQQLGRITVLEALAEETEAVGPSRSNISTPPQGDPDDQ